MPADAVFAELEHARKQGPLREIRIPPCPVLLARLRAALALPQPDMDEVQAIAAADVAMSATLLRVANSPMHLGGGLPCVHVGQALLRLGLKPAATLMTRFLVAHALPVQSPQLQRFWERSTMRSQAMEFLASQLPGLDAELAAGHGLFCHVGMPVMLQQLRGYGSTLVEAAARIDRPFTATEDANHRANHAVVGALTVRAWGLPPLLVRSVRLHHDFSLLAERGTEPELGLLVAAGLLAEQLMRRHELLEADADWQTHGEAALAWLGVSAVELEDWGDALASRFDASR